MKDWVETLTPLFVAIVPTIITIVATSISTRNTLGKKLDEHIRKSEEANMKNRRVRILRFADDICKGVLYTKEYWSDVLDDINEYTLYCEKNRETFRNAKCDIAMTYIKEEYGKVLRTNNFMGVE